MQHYTDNLILYYLALFIISSRLGYIFTVTYISFILSTAFSSMQSFKNTKWNKMNKTCVCVSMATVINVLNYMEKGDLAFIIPWSFWRKSKWEAYSRTYIRVLGNWFIPKISFIILFIKTYQLSSGLCKMTAYVHDGFTWSTCISHLQLQNISDEKEMSCIKTA